MELRKNPFQLKKKQKDIYFTEQLLSLTAYHQEHCKSYAKILDAIGYESSEVKHYEELPYLPITLFKKLHLSSLEIESDHVRTVTSSGTGNQGKSQIVLDGETSILQQQVLASIGIDFLGKERMPMLVIDCPATLKRQNIFSARTSGVLGFSLFSSKRVFALHDDMTLALDQIYEFLDNFGNKPFLIFGFTFMVWQCFCNELEKRGILLDCRNGTLIHGGGWKNLQDSFVSRKKFQEKLQKVCGIKRVINYYGMAEQTGSIFMECQCGRLHVSDYSAVLIRNTKDFSLCNNGEAGLIQVMSLIPKSYPGHNLLTEDEGRILGIDDCPCGRSGTYFEVIGRIQNAELKGCSDIYAAEWGK